MYNFDDVRGLYIVGMYPIIGTVKTPTNILLK